MNSIFIFTSLQRYLLTTTTLLCSRLGDPSGKPNRGSLSLSLYVYKAMYLCMLGSAELSSRNSGVGVSNRTRPTSSGDPAVQGPRGIIAGSELADNDAREPEVWVQKAAFAHVATVDFDKRLLQEAAHTAATRPQAEASQK